MALLLYEVIPSCHSAFVTTTMENFRTDRLDLLGTESGSHDYGGSYDFSYYRKDKLSKTSNSADLKTEGFTSPAPTEPRLTYDCPFYEWTNSVTNKKLRVMTRAGVQHYFNRDPLLLGNHETITSQAMREECALFGMGWETLEIDDFGDFIYVSSYILKSRDNTNKCLDPIDITHTGAWGIALDASWNASVGEWVWPRSGAQVVQGVLTPWPWPRGSNNVPGSGAACNRHEASDNGNWHKVQFSSCPGKGLAPWWQYKGTDDATRYPVPLILISRPNYILNTNCHIYKGPNDETPPAELLIDRGGFTNICANTLFCGGRGRETGGYEFCEVAHDKMAVKYTVSNTAGGKNHNTPPNPDPNAKIFPSHICQKKPTATLPPRESRLNTTLG